MERIFLFCLMWAFGGALAADKQADVKKVYSAFFRTLCKGVIIFPEVGTVMDYFIDPATGEAIPWQSKVAAFTSSAPDIGGSAIVVPTADTVRLTYLLNNLVRNNHPVMFVGSAGNALPRLIMPCQVVNSFFFFK
jgi:dynein heavy chain